MSDPKSDMLLQVAQVTSDILAGNYVAAAPAVAKLAAMIEAYVVPPIDASSLDPSDRAAVDVEVDAEVSKT